MKRIILGVLLSAAAAAPAAGMVKLTGTEASVTEHVTALSDNRLLLSMELDISGLGLTRDRQFTVTPVIESSDSDACREFEPVIVAGHNLYYKHIRENDLDGTAIYKYGRSGTLRYSDYIDAEPWMENAVIRLRYDIAGCCGSIVARGNDTLQVLVKPVPPVPPVFKPAFRYISPVADAVKTRELKKRSYVDFPVNKTTIYPDYRNNATELSRITATIDSVRADSDITITSISIKGFASPEGGYKHNAWLAENRTAALKDYVENLYRFEPGFIKTDFEPEDWEGLRQYVEASSLASRDGILEIIDSDMQPDAKDARIRRRYPRDYAFLLKEVYPALRHSDYKIDYNVRTFTSLDDILRVLSEDPRKLSLSEFYRAAQSMTPGSPEYNEVFETAVRLYPADPAANLNAANTAMSRGDLDAAARYIAKAGDSPEAVYASGILAALRGDYTAALPLMQRAAKLKVADAPAAVDVLKEIIEFNENNKQ